MKTYCLYHANCPDGFCAAYVLNKTAPIQTNIRFIPVRYGEPVPSEVEDNSIVYILDFSYPPDVLLELTERSRLVIVLDHHKTAKEALRHLSHERLKIIFDMDKSGAQLAYDFFVGRPFNTLRYYPRLVKYVADYDLWKFQETCSDGVNLYIQSYKQTFNEWDKLFNSLECESSFDDVLNLTNLFINLRNVQVDRALATCQFEEWIIGHIRYSVCSVNSPIYRSEIGHALCERMPSADFAAVWYMDGDGKFRYSLRSVGDRDVSSVAKFYGGGGHKNAAGFVSDYCLAFVE